MTIVRIWLVVWSIWVLVLFHFTIECRHPCITFCHFSFRQFVLLWSLSLQHVVEHVLLVRNQHSTRHSKANFEVRKNSTLHQHWWYSLSYRKWLWHSVWLAKIWAKDNVMHSCVPIYYRMLHKCSVLSCMYYHRLVIAKNLIRHGWERSFLHECSRRKRWKLSWKKNQRNQILIWSTEFYLCLAFDVATSTSNLIYFCKTFVYSFISFMSQM